MWKKWGGRNKCVHESKRDLKEGKKGDGLP